MKTHHINNYLGKAAFLLLITFCGFNSARPQNHPNLFNENDTIVQGFSSGLSGTEFWYHSAVPDIHDSYLVRAIDGKQKAVWMTAPAPEIAGDSNVHFVWLAGLGANLGNVPMSLSINDKHWFTFGTSRNHNWEIEHEDGLRLSYRNAMVDGAGDLFGFMILSIPAEKVKPGEMLKLSVSGSASNSQAWYMTFLSEIPNGLTFKAYPALYNKDGETYQPVSVQLVYFGQPTKGTLYVNGKHTRDLDLSFGIQQFTIDMPAVEYPSPFTLKLSSPLINEEKMITLEPVRKWHMNFVQHSHTDIGYTRPQTEILAEHLRYIDYALDYCDATDDYPDAAKFKWSCEASFAVDNYILSRPKSQIERLKRRVDEGRIEITGMYFNFDETPDEQSYAASLQPIKRFKENGIDVKTAMQDDVNGIGWCFADFFPPLGVKYLNMGTHGHRALIAFDKPTAFWWESPSGSRLLTFRAEHYMTGNTLFGIHSQNFSNFEDKVMTYLEDLDRKGYPYDVIPIQHSGYQTDNAPPSTLASDLIIKWNQKYEWPKLRTATVSEFFEYIEENYSEDLPVIRGAWPDWWTDGYGSAAREVSAARQAHTDLIANQGALAMAQLLGSDLPPGIHDRLDLVNQAVLFYDEHTFGHAQSVREPYFEGTMEQRELKESYAWEAFRRSRIIGEEAMGLLQCYIRKDETHPTLTVFNTMNWDRSGLAKIYIDHQILPMGHPFVIEDSEGIVQQAQEFEHRSDGTYWGIWVGNVPGLGFKTFHIKILEVDETIPEAMKSHESGDLEIENEWYGIKIDKRHGTIRHLHDKQLNRELVDPQAEWKIGQFIFETLGNRSQMEAFTLTDYNRVSLDSVWFEAYETGPVWNTVRFKGESESTINPAGFILEIRVFNTTKRIDFVYTIRKKANTDPEAIYLAFPFQLDNGKIFCEVQGGVMEAGVDQIPGSSNDWNTVQNFAAIRNSDAQIVISCPKTPLMQFGGINTGRYKAGAVPESTHIYGWPMNNYWTTNFNADQRGELTFSYSITSGANPGNDFASKFGWGNRVPFLCRVLPPGKSNEHQLTSSVLSIDPNNLLMINARPLDEDKTILLHLREIAGKTADLKITSDKQKLSVTECDVLGSELDSDKKIFFKPFETKFIKLTWN